MKNGGVMNKKIMVASLMLLVILFTIDAKAQTHEAFTLANTLETHPEDGTEFRSYECTQDKEREGCKIKYTLGVGAYGETSFIASFIAFDLNLKNAISVGNSGSFPSGNHDVTIVLVFDNGLKARKTTHLERVGQYVRLSMNLNNFVDGGGEKLDAQHFLSTIVKSNITTITLILNVEDEYGYPELKLWEWELKSFKTAPTFNAMLQAVAQNQDGSSSNSNSGGNSLSKGTWRTHLRKVLDHPTHNYNNGDKYKGQVASYEGINRRQGLGLYWFNSDDIHFGAYVNGIKNGYAIVIASVGQNVNYCSNCVYFVGYYCDNLKCGKGKCYDKEGNLIYYGDFSNDHPIGTYPTTDNYSSYKFECIEYKGGDKYIGETYKGQRHGQGIYLLWKNGDAWYGPWKDGQRNGYGIHLYYVMIKK